MEQRTESRIERKIGIFVHVHTSDEKPELVGVSIACEATDFSPHGMQFKTELLLDPGTLINISIAIGSPFSMYLLKGEVRWAREDGEDLAMGVELLDGGRNDFDKWLDEFDQNFMADS